jgi:phytoene dehydrogenase-like protein
MRDVRFGRDRYDAIVIGSGPNGLAAAITIAQAGRSALVVEAQDSVGGGTHSAELTLPGFVHDVCSAVHPMGISSPFFRSLPLREHGLDWIEPAIPMAHPLDDGSAVTLEHSLAQTAAGLGEDEERYAKLFAPLVANWPKIEPLALGPIGIPAHPFAAARFGLVALRSAAGLARDYFRGERARALFAGLAAHSILPLERMPSAAIGLVIGLAAHRDGWPFVRGGSQRIADALASYLRSLGGEVVTGFPVRSLDDLPAAGVILGDVTPRQMVAIAGSRFPEGFRRRLERYRYGPGSCKIDWALEGPIPWRAEPCRRAGTVHVGGTFGEIAGAERAAWTREASDKPFVLMAQPTVFDPTRAPSGKHVAWGYCHVPNGSDVDMSECVERQIERFAPGFRNLILKRSVITAARMHLHNANLVGGDIGGGAVDLRQFFLRPTHRFYRTPAKGIYFCSSSTPPGPGVHGMCGHMAARTALRDTA